MLRILCSNVQACMCSASYLAAGCAGIHLTKYTEHSYVAMKGASNPNRIQSNALRHACQWELCFAEPAVGPVWLCQSAICQHHAGPVGGVDGRLAASRLPRGKHTSKSFQPASAKTQAKLPRGCLYCTQPLPIWDGQMRTMQVKQSVSGYFSTW